MFTLDSLPPELIQQIGTELGNNVKELRLVCKRMSSVLESHILRSIVIDIMKPRLDVSISQLTTLAARGSHVATATHKLHIRNLCPSKDPIYRSPIRVFDPDTEAWVNAPPAPHPPEVIAEEKMQAMLQVAIASLGNLRSFKWNIRWSDSKWTPTAVINAVKTLPLLESLELIVEKGFDMADLQLQPLRNLQSIKISSPYKKSFVQIIEPLSLLIARSPNLHTLHLGPTYCASTSLHRLLGNCPPNVVLPLKHLDLQGFSLKLDSIRLPHFHRLTSLTRHDCRTSESGPDGPYASTADRSHPDEIWAILKTTDVRLNGIDVDHIPTTLLDYISSYSGLKKLCLAPLKFKFLGESDPAANQFYNLCLGKHASTLEELIVMADIEGGWCLGDDALVVISLCKKLRVLGGSLVSEALNDAMKSLVDVTTQLPRIEKLTVRPANLEDFSSYACADPKMSHFQHVTKQLSRCIREYEFSKPVPLIIVNPRMFMLQPSGGAGSVLRYQCNEPDDIDWWF